MDNVYSHIGTYTQTHWHPHRQTREPPHTDIPPYTPLTDTQTDRYTDTHAHRHRCRQPSHRHPHTDTQTHICTHAHKHTPCSLYLPGRSETIFRCVEPDTLYFPCHFLMRSLKTDLYKSHYLSSDRTNTEPRSPDCQLRFSLTPHSDIISHER